TPKSTTTYLIPQKCRSHGIFETSSKALAEGVKAVPDCNAELKKAEDAKMDDLASCDALVLGSPVHMGSIDWRVKKFIDTVCSGAWMQDKIVGKVGAVFASGAGYGGGGGGCELTMLALMNNLAELGLIIVPLPKSTPGYQSAGLQWGPYGRAHAEDLSPKGLSDDQLLSSHHHGKHVARAAKALKGSAIFS
ncbi:MAG: NAD(P)H-dependent oxidoreductase, partial [Desulfomonilaceae bacterium]